MAILEDMVEENTTYIMTDMDAVADVDATANVIVHVEIKEVHGEGSSPKKKSERNWKNIRNNWNMKSRQSKKN